MSAAETAAPVSAGRPSPGRRTYVIDRGFQLKYTLLLMILGAVMSALFGTMMYLAHVQAQADVNVPADVRAQLDAADTTMLSLVVAITILMGGALGLLGVLITHRVAGPVYVMSHYITTLARGRYPTMRPLRKSDELQSFFTRFQEAVETLRQREVEEAATLDRAIAAIRSGGDSQTVLRELEAVASRKREATDRVDAGR